MRSLLRLLVPAMLVIGIVAFPLAAGAGHENDPRTPNLKPMGHIFEPASLLNPAIGNPDIHTDIAFWGKFAIQGNWDGFNIRNISSANNPRQVSRTFCDGNQGDVIIWDVDTTGPNTAPSTIPSKTRETMSSASVKPEMSKNSRLPAGIGRRNNISEVSSLS